MIDPGHGGRDPGAIGVRGTYEKDVTLDIALEMARRLSAARGVTPLLTRTNDTFLPLRARVAKARAAQADLFLSVHADSAPSPEARGLSAYTLSATASDDFAARLAAQENLADGHGGIDLRETEPEIAAILLDLALRHSRHAARAAQERIVRGAGKRLRLLDNPLRSANFAVLKAPDVPSVLIETGFLSNRHDEDLLRTPAHRRRIAEVLATEIAGLMADAPFA